MELKNTCVTEKQKQSIAVDWSSMRHCRSEGGGRWEGERGTASLLGLSTGAVSQGFTST